MKAEQSDVCETTSPRTWRVTDAYRGSRTYAFRNPIRAWELWERISPAVQRRRFLARIFEDAFQSRLRKRFKRGYRSRSKIGICELARRAEPSRAEPERNRNPRESRC